MDKEIKAAQTASEEILNSLTHGLGLIVTSGGTGAMITLAALTGCAWKIVASSIFCFTMILLYMASTTYHSAQPGKTKNALALFDHCAIYFLIAGTYTPFLLINLRGTMGWTLFVIIWLMAIFGSLFQVFCAERHPRLSVLTYLTMGWMVLMVIRPVFEALTPGGIIFMLFGAAAYTFGVVFYVLHNRVKFFHGIWHLFVLAGSIMFYFSILFGSILKI